MEKITLVKATKINSHKELEEYFLQVEAEKCREIARGYGFYC